LFRCHLKILFLTLGYKLNEPFPRVADCSKGHGICHNFFWKKEVSSGVPASGSWRDARLVLTTEGHGLTQIEWPRKGAKMRKNCDLLSALVVDHELVAAFLGYGFLLALCGDMRRCSDLLGVKGTSFLFWRRLLPFGAVCCRSR
jgi:hypothetical protein